ncbi:hypothetical protein CEXT_78671 [Caerostris extrusa]|uniref:Uncharacterized protein n=1 Tax=Caerostris extrusa TaxID=172846 RepID=A0AAV4S9F1_CAEEX|nr:hypothetical protein CEXT_78671 [Caerostris extrusa]
MALGIEAPQPPKSSRPAQVMNRSKHINLLSQKIRLFRFIHLKEILHTLNDIWLHSIDFQQHKRKHLFLISVAFEGLEPSMIGLS